MKLNKISITGSCSILLFSITSAMAGPIADKKAHDEYVETNKSELETADKDCNTKFKFTIEMAEYKAEEWKSGAPACAQAFNAIESLCKQKEYKDAVVKHIKAIKCFPSNKGEAKMVGTTLEYRSPSGEGTVMDEAVKTMLISEIDK